MKRLLLLPALFLSACGGCSGDDDGDDTGPTATFDECDSDSQAWVRNAYLAIVGHRPHSQAEVDVYVQLLDQLEEKHRDEDTWTPKQVVARAMTAEPGYLKHWTSHFIDALRVAREDEQNMQACYGDRDTSSVSGALASFVRDNPPTMAAPGDFTMLDLVESSLVLDDVTPIYRGHLFALVSYPIPAANVPDVQAELARREDYGNIFDSAYLNRDMVCLTCHNSELSVTDNADPALDRHWPMAGQFEAAIYTAPSGAPAERAHAMFRFQGFSATGFGENGPRVPWSWDLGCGSFYNNPGTDPADVDGLFAGLTGKTLTVYDLEGVLRSGLASLRDGGLEVGTDGTIEDPAQALAYLMSATIVEGVWKEVVGSGLTIANYFPRNQAARDLLQSVTDAFVANGYSLQELLVQIVSSDYFSRLLPEDGCGPSPYIYPNVWDPWVISDSDESRRQNGPGDSIAAISARTLMRTAYEALEWPEPQSLDFPSGGGGDEPFCEGASCSELEDACNQQGFCCDTYEAQCLGGGGDDHSFQQGVGAFLKNGERGFRGLDFQARLVWEERFGACTNTDAGQDFVDELVAAANADPSASVEDVIAAIKDRLIGESVIDDEGDPSEATQLEMLFGGPLDRTASTVTDLESSARQLCGVLLSSPQFVLSGAAGRGGEVPKLTPEPWTFDTVCTAVSGRVSDATVSCSGDGSLTVE